MTDIAIRPTSIAGAPISFDIAIENGDLAHDDGLRTAVILSLFLDRRAEDGDVASGADRRGSWMDATLDDPNDKLGSRLWLLSREKELPATAQRARLYTEEALAWLVAEGVASRIETDATWIAPGVLQIHVQIFLVNGSVWEDRLQYPTGG